LDEQKAAAGRRYHIIKNSSTLGNWKTTMSGEPSVQVKSYGKKIEPPIETLIYRYMGKRTWILD